MGLLIYNSKLEKMIIELIHFAIPLLSDMLAILFHF